MVSEFDEGYDPFNVSGSTENVTKEDAQKGGGGAGVAKAGFYHVTVESVDFKVEADKEPHVLVVMKTLAAEEKMVDQVGRKIYHRIYPKPMEEEDKEQKRINALASFMFQMGVMTEEEAFGNPTFVCNRQHFMNLEGCQAVVKVTKREAREYEDRKTKEKKMGKESYDVYNNDVWHLEHEKVKDVPKDWQMAQLAPKVTTKDQLAADLDGV